LTEEEKSFFQSKYEQDQETLESLFEGHPRFKLKGIVGKGWFAAVYKVEQKQVFRGRRRRGSVTRSVAFKLPSMKQLKIIENEVRILNTISDKLSQEQASANHLMAVPLNMYWILDSLGRKRQLAIAMNYYPMDLLDRMTIEEKLLNYNEMQNVGRQLFQALHVLHEQAEVTHNDVKAANILIKSETLEIALADFSLSSLTAELPQNGAFGTLHYFAPEAIFPIGHMDQKLDIWAAGMVLFQAATGVDLMYCRHEYREAIEDMRWNIIALFGRRNIAEELIPTSNVAMGGLFLKNIQDLQVETNGFKDNNIDYWIKNFIVENKKVQMSRKKREKFADLLKEIFRWSPQERPSAAKVLSLPFFS
jgi:serine/threonine protein kinase